MVESPPADAVDTGSCPGPGGSHVLRSGWAHEPWPLSLHVRSLCSSTGEATTVRGPRTTKIIIIIIIMSVKFCYQYLAIRIEKNANCFYFVSLLEEQKRH